MAGKREALREMLTQKLLDAATKRIERNGLDSLRARDVTDDAGCGLGTIYKCYRDLDDLVLHVNSATLARLAAELEASAANIDAPREKLTAFALAYLDFARRNRHLWFALFDHRMPEGVAVPDWHLQEHAALFQAVADPLAGLRPDLDEAQLLIRARTIFAAVHGVIALSLQERFIGVPGSALEAELKALVALVVSQPAEDP